MQAPVSRSLKVDSMRSLGPVGAGSGRPFQLRSEPGADVSEAPFVKLDKSEVPLNYSQRLGRVLPCFCLAS